MSTPEPNAIPPLDEPRPLKRQSGPGGDKPPKKKRGLRDLLGNGPTLFVVIGVIACLAITALALAALFLPPFELASRFGAASQQTLNEPGAAASHPDGITVTLRGDAPLSVRLASIPREVFLESGAERDYPGALGAIPPVLTMKSPLYVVNPEGDGQATVEIVIPNDAEPYRTLDLYRWDETLGAWVFVPGHVDVAAGVIRTDEVPSNIAVFQAGATTPLLSTVAEPDQPLEDIDLSPFNIVLAAGLEASADGSLVGEPAAVPAGGAGFALIPLVRTPDADTLAALLATPDALTAHVDALVATASTGDYRGIAIDYSDLDPASGAEFTTFVQRLSDALAGANRMLVVLLPAPADTGDGWDTAGYDWRAIGAASDIVVVRPDPNPANYAADGSAIRLLDWAVGEVNRYKLHVASSAASYDETADAALSYAEAVGLLGGPTVEPGVIVDEGTELTFSLSGDVGDFAPNEPTATYTFSADGQRIWLVTPAAIRTRLDTMMLYHVGGMAVDDLPLGLPAETVQAITAFKVNSAPAEPGEFAILWSVSDTSGAVLSETTGPGTPWAWRPDAAGGYIVQGQAVSAATTDLGAIAVQVGDEEVAGIEPGTVITPGATTTPAPTGTPNPDATATPTPTEAVPNLPAPVAPGGSDGGGFALGGQVPGYIGHPDYMRSAGMTWVKYQVVWTPGASPAAAGGMVGEGHSHGFSVLLSIKGPLYPSSIDYDAYVTYVGQVAAYAPDAIEVWNEMNLNREWPSGQIDPVNYVSRMLAPSFNAIKSASPGTLVIIGALAPTGVDDGVNVWSDQRYVQGLASAGAARYANCIGVHHNAGATSPSASSGHPAGGHYSWYFQPTINVYYGGMGGALPVCFTEYGYVSPEGYGELPGNFSWGADNTVAEQAAWLKEGADIARSLGYVRLMIIWNVDFPTWAPDDPQAGYAIIRPDGTCPACDLLP